MGKPSLYSKKHILEAIKGSGSIVSAVATRLKCDWNTAKKYINKWPETIAAMAAEEQIILDNAESTLFNSINAGNSQDAKWLLATKGKNRGYNDKIEIEHSGSIDITSMTPEQRENRINELLKNRR